MTTTRADLAKALRTEHGLTAAQADAAVTTVFDRIAAAAANGEVVQIRGFGTFRQRVRAAGPFRNPATGQPINLPEKRTLVFKAVPARRT